MVRNVAAEMADLDAEDFHLLSGVEHGMRFSRWVNREKLPEFSRLTAEEVDYRLDRMLDLEFLERKTIQYEGVQLTFAGYDALALHTFAERETVDGFGAPLGVGKESDVYEVQSYRPMALKFHREGTHSSGRSTAAATTPATRSTRPGSTPPGRPPNGSTTPWRPLPGRERPAPGRPEPPRHRDGEDDRDGAVEGETRA